MSSVNSSVQMDEQQLLERMRNYDELLRSMDSSPLFELTSKGKDAAPRYLSYENKNRDKPTPREEISQKKSQQQSADVSNRPASASKRRSSGTDESMQSPPKRNTTPSRYLQGFEKTLTMRDQSPRRKVEEEKRKREESFAILQKRSEARNNRSPSRNTEDQNLGNVSERSSSSARKRNTTPSRYLNGITPEPGQITPRMEVELKREESRKSLISSKPPLLSPANLQRSGEDHAPLRWSVSGGSLLSQVDGPRGSMVAADVMVLRNVRNPSEELSAVFQAYCLLFGLSPCLRADPTSQQGLKLHDWVTPFRNACQKAFQMIKALAEYDPHSVSKDVFKKLRRVVREPFFTPQFFMSQGPEPAVKLVEFVLDVTKKAAINLGEDPDVIDVKYADKQPTTPPKKVVELLPRETTPLKVNASLMSPTSTSPHVVFGSTMPPGFTPAPLSRSPSATSVHASASRGHSRSTSTGSATSPRVLKSPGHSMPFEGSTQDTVVGISESAFRSIASRLSERDIANLALTCKSFFCFACDPSVWESQILRKSKVLDVAAQNKQNAADILLAKEEQRKTVASQLSQDEVETLQGYENPSDSVRAVLECVSKVLGLESLTSVSAADVHASIRNLDAAALLPLEVRSRVPRSHDLDESVLKKTSRVAVMFAKWIEAVAEVAKCLDAQDAARDEHRNVSRDLDKIRVFVTQRSLFE
eukprot:ANDGO_04531.mRNA.1 hypothetical protein